MGVTYKNTITGATVDQDSIISNTSNGIVYSNKTSWKYVPPEYVETETEIQDDGTLFEPEDIPEYTVGNEHEDLINDDNGVSGDYYTEKAQYVFGFEIKNLKKYQEAVNSVVVSKEIDLGAFSYITIESKEDTDDNSIIEYSILSGNKELPIVPENYSDRITEKMFYGLDTRFMINGTGTKSIIYEDGIESAKTSPSFSDFEKHNYKIEYNAGGEIYKIIPPQSKIRLKVVIRNSGTVRNIIIKKYGGEIGWN